MSTAHELMERLHSEGAARFAATTLAHDHGGVQRRVRRQRAVRTSLMSVAGVVAVGAAAAGLSQLATDTAPPAGTPTPPVSPSTPTQPAPIEQMVVTKQERIESIAASLAGLYGVTDDEALAAIVAALPPEANGEPEGWVGAGTYSLDASVDLREAAQQLVTEQTKWLYSLGVPNERWRDTIVLASIVQAEAPVLADQGVVARVLTNRLEHGVKLEVQSPLAYYLRADEQPVGDDGWAVDTPYNTYMYKGLPPGAIGAPTPESVEAAANPSDGAWLYMLRKPDGNTLVFTTFEEFAVAVDEYFPGTGASD